MHSACTTVAVVIGLIGSAQIAFGRHMKPDAFSDDRRGWMGQDSHIRDQCRCLLSAAEHSFCRWWKSRGHFSHQLQNFKRTSKIKHCSDVLRLFGQGQARPVHKGARRFLGSRRTVGRVRARARVATHTTRVTWHDDTRHSLQAQGQQIAPICIPHSNSREILP